MASVIVVRDGVPWAVVPEEDHVAVVRELSEARAELLQVAQAMGYSYAPDTGPDAPAPIDVLVRAAREGRDARHEIAEARAELERVRRALAVAQNEAYFTHENADRRIAEAVAIALEKERSK